MSEKNQQRNNDVKELCVSETVGKGHKITSKTNQRIEEIVGRLSERLNNLDSSTLYTYIHASEENKPQWFQILCNRDLYRSRNRKRHLPMLESDPVIKMLGDMRRKIENLLKTKDPFESRFQSLSETTKLEFISVLRYIIQERNLDPFLIYSNGDKDSNYSFSDNFENLEELYNFLLEVSKKSEKEKEVFLKKEIPSNPWNISFGPRKKS